MLKNVNCNESKTGSIDSPMPWDKTFLTKLLKVSFAGIVVVIVSCFFRFFAVFISLLVSTCILLPVCMDHQRI